MDSSNMKSHPCRSCCGIITETTALLLEMHFPRVYSQSCLCRENIVTDFALVLFRV